MIRTSLVLLICLAAGLLGGSRHAHADRVRLRPTVWLGAGYDANPLVLSTAAAPSAVGNAGAWLNLDLAFGPFTRIYTQAGGVVTMLPAVELTTATAFADIRALRRAGAVDVELRTGLSGSDVSSTAASPSFGPPPVADGPDLESVATTGDSWSATTSLSVSSLPGPVRGGLAATGSRTMFPYRYVPGSTVPEEVSQAGILGFLEVRHGRWAAAVSGRGISQDSAIPQQRGYGGEGHAGVWFELRPEVMLRVRGEARRFLFPEDGFEGRVDGSAGGQAGITLGRAGRLLRVDLAANAMRFYSTRGNWEATRTSVQLTFQVRPPAVRR